MGGREDENILDLGILAQEASSKAMQVTTKIFKTAGSGYSFVIRASVRRNRKRHREAAESYR